MIYVESILSFVNYLIFIKNIKHYNNISWQKYIYIFKFVYKALRGIIMTYIIVANYSS